MTTDIILVYAPSCTGIAILLSCSKRLESTRRRLHVYKLTVASCCAVLCCAGWVLMHRDLIPGSMGHMGVAGVCGMATAHEVWVPPHLVMQAQG